MQGCSTVGVSAALLPTIAVADVLFRHTVSLLYFAVFCAIAWLWRPSDNNHRLAMSDELATDDVEDFEIDDLETGKDDGSPRHVGQDDVVFDVRSELARCPHPDVYPDCCIDWRGR